MASFLPDGVLGENWSRGEHGTVDDLARLSVVELRRGYLEKAFSPTEVIDVLAEVREQVRSSLGDPDEPMPWALIRLALQSPARLAVVPAQDLLGLDNEETNVHVFPRYTAFDLYIAEQAGLFHFTESQRTDDLESHVALNPELGSTDEEEEIDQDY